MSDRYTKVTLTVIAAALVVLAIKQLTPIASATGTGACGTKAKPCFVAVERDRPLELVISESVDPKFKFKAVIYSR